MTKRNASSFEKAQQPDFPAMDTRILELWDELDAFAASIAQRPTHNEYTFYDGPPFATGSPHYGNLLAGVIKDIVPRYWTMRGYRIERRFGWDTHGLPVEMEVEKQLGVSGPKQIAELGVDKFNQACRRLVEQATDEWEVITRRIGRWVDFGDDYKTMDLAFMESVWWVFKQLWDKGLIYQDFKVLPYSFGATTPLSNFEANMDYREVEDPSITVRLRVLKDHGPAAVGDWVLIWTTTPWTLPGNLALAVAEDTRYVRVVDGDDRYWVAEARAMAFWEDPEIDRSATGAELVGASYEPPFDYFGEERDRGAFRFLAGSEVTADEGTGVVHMAPAYGEADFLALQAAGLDVLVDPVDAEGKFTSAVPDVSGLNVKEADAVLMDLLAEQGLLVRRETIRHSYPFCWRTETPLIYKAIPTWFVRVTELKDRMVELNNRIHWVPESVGRRRFGNWLADARDWAISRNRYWGSCIPVWECESCQEQVCVGSIDELEELSGIRPNDLHKHIVDDITFSCSKCQGRMVRVPEVLDCWFESGSMPYAQLHYPFENAEAFERRFPANFIAEGLDQTRGWFYTLVVIATALFDKEPFQNCVVNGMILAEDGRKMSKSLRNYPDPNRIVDSYGADALRAALIDSPVVRAEPIRFREEDVREVVRTVLLPLWNAYSFFSTYADADGVELSDVEQAPPPQDRPELDRWILSVLQSLIRNFNEEMEGYYLYAVVRPTLSFISDLTNWYIRRSRRRFWKTRSDDDSDKLAAFATLYEVLVTFSRVLAPVLPFVTEFVYQRLVADLDLQAPRSVHLCDYPRANRDLIDPTLESEMNVVRRVVRLGRALRKQHGLRVRQPLSTATIVTTDPTTVSAVESHLELIADELNVKHVATARDESAFVDFEARPDFRLLGPRLGADVQDVAKALESLPPEDLQRLLAGEVIDVAKHRLSVDDIEVRRLPKPGLFLLSEADTSVVLDVHLSEELLLEGLARDVISLLQQLRRDEDLDVSDRIRVWWDTADDRLAAAVETHELLISGEVLAAQVTRGDVSSAFELGDASIGLRLERV